MLSANTISQTEGVLQIYTCAHLSYHRESRFEEVVFLDDAVQSEPFYKTADNIRRRNVVGARAARGAGLNHAIDGIYLYGFLRIGHMSRRDRRCEIISFTKDEKSTLTDGRTEARRRARNFMTSCSVSYRYTCSFVFCPFAVRARKRRLNRKQLFLLSSANLSGISSRTKYHIIVRYGVGERRRSNTYRCCRTSSRAVGFAVNKRTK